MADAHPKFDVSVVTPDGAVYDGEAEMIVVPGAVGDIGVLARHAPLVATLKAGSTRIYLGDSEVLEFATGPGFFKVELDVIEWNTLFTNWRRGAKDETARGAHAINVTFAAMDPFFAMVRFTSSAVSPPRSRAWKVV